jgi:hypothetical protein
MASWRERRDLPEIISVSWNDELEDFVAGVAIPQYVA